MRRIIFWNLCKNVAYGFNNGQPDQKLGFSRVTIQVSIQEITSSKAFLSILNKIWFYLLKFFLILSKGCARRRPKNKRMSRDFNLCKTCVNQHPLH